VSLQKLKACLEVVEADRSAESELVVGFQGDGAAPEFARLSIEATQQDGQGGLVCTLDAPFNPFDDQAKFAQRTD
jgi:hypothetical protein